MSGENTTGAAPAETTGAQGAQTTGAQAEPVIDYGEILAKHQHELARTGKTVEELRGELNKSQERLTKVRHAFTDEQEQKPTAYQTRRQAYNDLGQYLDAEAKLSLKRGGEGIPVTTKIGQQLIDLGLESEQRAERLEQELADIRAQLKRQQNPAFQGLERAAFVMEGMVEEALESLYGAEQGARGIRASQFNAVTSRINEEIKDLMQNDPEALLKVQRNPKIMRKMVNHFMAEMLPPKVRSMLDDQRVMNEPMSQRDLFQAFAEARQNYDEATANGNEKAVAQYSNLMTEIRQDLLAGQLSGRRGGTEDKPSINSLLANVYGSAGGR